MNTTDEALELDVKIEETGPRRSSDHDYSFGQGGR